jgi:pSer/pThr/pTyr-binding forkhead associated (FHA) protein
VHFGVARVCTDGSLGQRFPLDQPGIIAGQKGQIALTDDPSVAPEHARFTQLGEGVYVEDLGSPLGVYLSVREPQRLKDGDIIQIGRERLRFVLHKEDSPAEKSVSPGQTAVLVAGPGVRPPVAALHRLDSNDQEMERYELRDVETSFGRSKGTYTFPDDPFLSAIHAQIRLLHDRYILEDLGSTNGTFARIRKRSLAREGDTVMIGRQLLRVFAERPSGWQA